LDPRPLTMNFDNTLKSPSFIRSSLLGLVMLIASLASVYVSTHYANVNASNSVTDLILSNTRVYEVDGIFVYGAMAAVLFSIVVIPLFKLSHIPFILKSASLFLVIRSIFVSLTHISPYPYRATIEESFFSSYTFFQTVFNSDDLFFSGHVGLTFLMSLLLWESRVLRYIYLIISVIFAVVVLLGHFHYSIDVFGAYFITYTIYVMSLHFFKRDCERTLA